MKSDYEEELAKCAQNKQKQLINNKKAAKISKIYI